MAERARISIAFEDGGLVFAGRLRVSLQRTLRVPDDGGTYPLPPGLGLLPLMRVSDSTFVVPMYQREAVWIGFAGSWPPMAVQVGVGMINALSGRPWSGTLDDAPQNYVVCPEQLWLDGINAGAASVRQFVAMPLGSGHSIEQSLTGRESAGGIQLAVHDIKPGVTLVEPAPRLEGPRIARAPQRMNIGAGGRITQKIYPDPHGIEVWDGDRPAIVHIEILNSAQYQALTGRTPPPTPVDARLYTEHGLPWFELYDEHQEDLAAPEPLSSVKTIADVDRETGSGDAERPIAIDEAQINRITRHRQ